MIDKSGLAMIDVSDDGDITQRVGLGHKSLLDVAAAQ
jgi:hypothetical protein